LRSSWMRRASKAKIERAERVRIGIMRPDRPDEEDEVIARVELTRPIISQNEIHQWFMSCMHVLMEVVDRVEMETIKVKVMLWPPQPRFPRSHRVSILQLRRKAS